MSKKVISKFLGIDLGFNFTGWSVIDYVNTDKFTYILSWVIKNSPKTEYSQILNQIFNHIEYIYVNTNNRSLIMLVQDKDAPIIDIFQNEEPLVEYAAKKVKKNYFKYCQC